MALEKCTIFFLARAHKPFFCGTVPIFFNLVPRDCVPLDQRSGNSKALDESKSEPGNPGFRLIVRVRRRLWVIRTSFQ